MDLLIPFIPENILCVWECACGSGKITKRLELCDKHYTVVSTDLRGKDTGFNSSQYGNFLTDPLPEIFKFYGFNDLAIITNPPYSVKEQFIDKAFEYNVPFAFLINADYSGLQISWIKRGCEKIIPNRRISYLTPDMLNRVNKGEQSNYLNVSDIPGKVLKKYTASQFHSMWLTHGFGLGATEIFVDLPLESMLNF